MGRAFEAISIADLVEQRKSSVRPEFCDQYERARGRQLNCSPTLDQGAGLFPGSSGQRGPYAADRPISSIGALLPIAL
jgi:hypothetical protein